MKKYILIIGIFASSLISIIGFSQNISINTTGAANSSNSMLEVIQPAGAATGTIGLYINHPGTAGTIYGLQAIVNGTATTHYAGYFSATSATNNYSIVVPSGGGFAGIGTTSPSAQLTIVSPDNGVENIFQVYPQNLTQGVATGYNYVREIGSNGNNTMYLDAQGTGYLLFQTVGTGNVGIKTASPQQNLSVNGYINVDQAGADAGGTGGGVYHGISFGSGSGEAIGSNRSGAGSNQWGLDFYTGWNKWMSVTNGGNVGIGTSAPAAKLHINAGDLGISRIDGGDPTPYCRLGLSNGWEQYLANNAFYNSATSQWNYVNTGGYGGMASMLYQISGWLGFYTASNAANPVAWNQRMTILNNGNVGIGTTSPGYKLTVSGGAIGGNYGLLPNYAGWAAYGTGDGGAAIYNDNGSYQTLMLVGNNSGGGARQVSVWDYLTVNGNQTITGLAGTGDRLVMAHSNGQLFIGSINQGYGSNVQWIDGTTDISLSTKGVWTNITDMVITFTPVHSTVLAEFSCSGDVAGGYPLTEDVLIRFLVDGATVYAGGAVICEDDDNANYVSGWNIHCVRPIALSVGVSHTIQMQWYLQNTPEAKTVAIRAATGLGWAHRTLFIDD